PRLSAMDQAHPSMLVVASPAAVVEPRKTRATPGPPPLSTWSEEQWEKHRREIRRDTEALVPYWIITVFATVIVAFVLKLAKSGALPIIVALLVGAITSAALLVRYKSSSGTYAVLTAAALVLAVMCLIPVLALTVLFIGCGGCQ